jgi:hypothetical protein
MSFLNKNNAEFISSRLTQKGRNSIAKGNFKISHFQIGDSEFNYTTPFDELTGVGSVESQKVLSPSDKDTQIKYPYKLDVNTTSTTYGDVILNSSTETIRNGMGPAGFVSEYVSGGTTIECNTELINISSINGTNSITVADGDLYNNTKTITIVFDVFVNITPTINNEKTSLVYRVLSTSGNTLIIDRNLPDLSTISGFCQIVSNECDIEYPNQSTEQLCAPIPIDPLDQHDPWTLDVVWNTKPMGFDVNGVDENIKGFETSNMTSTMEYLGYNTSNGQQTNIGTTYKNTYGEEIIVSPEEQRCVAILHYSKLGDITTDPDRFYKYDDYIGNSATEGILIDGEVVFDTDFFQVYIPFINYHRKTTSTIGSIFYMDVTEHSLMSKFSGSPDDIRPTYLKYNYLLDEEGNSVGKIFTGKKIIVFDDQEIVASLDYKSNRRYTLPAPKCTLTPSDELLENSLFDGTDGQTYWVTYMFNYTSDIQLNGLPCNYYSKVTQPDFASGECVGSPIPSNISLKFNSTEFTNLKTTFPEVIDGFIADGFKILVQETLNDEIPTTDGWIEIDMTSLIPNHVSGLIDPTNLVNYSFTITKSLFDNGTLFDLETYLGSIPDEPSTLPQFGDEQPFPGSIKLVRNSDIEHLNFLVNLPSSQFNSTQNPTYVSGNKKITEIGLLDENKELLIIGKTSKPVNRVGTQVFAIKLDF